MVPEVSLLLAVYNGASYLQEALQSVLHQTLTSFELVVVDDGSQDDTFRILRDCRDPRLRILRNAANLGLARSLNRGLDEARGRYVARMDADDICHPRRLERQVRFLERHPHVGLCGTAIAYFGDHRSIRRYPVDDAAIKIELLFINPFAHPTVMFRRDVFARFGLRYNPEFRCTEDFDLWSRAAQHLRFSNLRQPLLRYRLHGGQITQARQERMSLEYRSILTRNLTGLDLTLSEEETGLHEQAMHQTLEACPENLFRLSDHLNRLLNANCKTHRYPEHLFRRRCSDVLKRMLIRGYRTRRLSPSDLKRLTSRNLLTLADRLNLGRSCLSHLIRTFGP